MTYKLLFNTTRVNQNNLVKCLEPSLRAFYGNEESRFNNLVFKYLSAISDKEITFCSLEIENELIASCLLVSSSLKLNGLNLPIFFLTQVVTEKKFRRMGYFALLLQKIEEFSRQKKRNILIVIARRAVTDLYWKFGFKGFSHFPEYNLKSSLKFPTLNSFNIASNKDLEILRYLHLQSVNSSNCKIARSKLFWQFILKNQSELNCKVLIPKDKMNQNYFILQNNVLIEASSRGDHQNLSSFFIETRNLFNQVKLDRFHSISRDLSLDIWDYTERFEAKEGHLYKLLDTLPKGIEYFFKEIARESGTVRLEISPLDQW